MAPHARTLGLVAALLTAAMGLPTPARGEADAAPVPSGFRVVADARWDRALTVRYRAEAAPAARSGSEAPSFRSGSGEAAGSRPAPLPPLTRDRLWAPSEYIEAGVPFASRPGPAGDWLEVVVPAERDLGLFLAAQSALLVDMAQTLEISQSTGFRETNQLLGERPSDGTVLAYFGAIAAVHAATYVTLDGRWANVVSRAILFVQVPAIDSNARLGVRISF